MVDMVMGRTREHGRREPVAASSTVTPAGTRAAASH